MIATKQANILGKGARRRFILFIVLSSFWIAADTAFADGIDGKLRAMTQNLYDDLVFVKGLSVADTKLVGDQSADKSPSGLWPSDHAGIVAMLR
jgi:hypothetical protein